jgi:hypothetical protein
VRFQGDFESVGHGFLSGSIGLIGFIGLIGQRRAVRTSALNRRKGEPARRRKNRSRFPTSSSAEVLYRFLFFNFRHFAFAFSFELSALSFQL